MKDHTHDCTGPDGRCPCGYVMRVPRFLFDFDVWDNDTKTTLASDGFNCDDIGVVIDALRKAADDLERFA